MQTITEINQTRSRNGLLTGTFFISATVTAIIAMLLYGPLLYNEAVPIDGVSSRQLALTGVIFELLLVVSAMGTAVMFYPQLKKASESAAIAYVAFRLLEVVLILAGIFAMLALLSLDETPSANPETNLLLRNISIDLKQWTMILGPNLMLGINTFIYSRTFSKHEMLPKRLSSLGLLGAALILIAAVLQMFGYLDQRSGLLFVMAFPVFIYEMILAGWLIKNGLKINNKKQINQI